MRGENSKKATFVAAVADVVVDAIAFVAVDVVAISTGIKWMLVTYLCVIHSRPLTTTAAQVRREHLEQYYLASVGKEETGDTCLRTL